MGIQAGIEGQGDAGGYWVKRGDVSSLKLVPAGGGEGGGWSERRARREGRKGSRRRSPSGKVGERRRFGKEANPDGSDGPYTRDPTVLGWQGLISLPIWQPTTLFSFVFLFSNFQCALLAGQVSNFIHVHEINK